MSLTLEVPKTSKVHKTLIDAAIDRKKYSQKKMQDMQTQWDDADDSMRAYIPEKEQDRIKKDKKKYKGDVDYTTLEVPYVYAQVMTAHTYWCTVFLSRSPIWQFSGRHGETQDSIDAVEAIMDYQVKVGTQLPVLYNAIYDWARYSLGVVGIYWEKEEKTISVYQDVPKSFMGIPIPGKPERKRVEKQVPGYIGNKLFNIRPQDFFPDPRVPIARFQEGEFVICESVIGYSNLLQDAQGYPGYYMNLEELKKVIGKKNEKSASSSGYVNPGNPRTNEPLQGEQAGIDQPGYGFLKIKRMHIKVVPKEWGLNNSERVQKWEFIIAEDELVIRAAPLGTLDDEFPYAVLEGNFGNDAFAKAGLIEIIRPMTDIITWLVNSHFYNVRKTLNDTVFLDPTAVVVKDYEKAKKGAGGVIRLKPAGYGRDVRQFAMQMQNMDATRSHLTDISVVENMLQKVGGVVDNIMGSQNQSSRKSATEARISSNWSMNRLKTPADYNSALGFDRMARIMLANTQEKLDIERKYSIAGNTAQTAQKFLEVNPESIAGFYDFVPVDGSLPIDPMAKAQFWKELLIQMARVPQFSVAWDINGMVAHMMKMQGERNIDRFRLNVLPPGVGPSAGAMPLGVPGGQAPPVGGNGPPPAAGGA